LAGPTKAELDHTHDTAFRARGLWPLAGIDEAGCGPLAGPVCAAAVILNPEKPPRGVNDSKAMTAKAREAAFGLICETALSVSFAFATAAEIDALNIRKAALLAMTRAVAGLSLRPAFALVDGRFLPDLPCPGEAIVKGDATSLSIASASIVAKVMRDAMMRRLSERHPEYGFAENAGYGVPRHLAAIEKFGPTPYHRMSFSPLRDRAEEA
jgi:ribonuclease HII